MGSLITEEKRQQMAIGASILCFMMIGPSVALVAVGGYAKMEVESKIRLIESFNTAALPGVIMFLGLYSTIHNAASGAVLLSCRRSKMREKRSSLLFPGVIFGAILFLTLFVMAMVSFGQTWYLNRAFDKGIYKAMKNYKTNKTLKIEIDTLQIDFRCCGNNKYTDWFKISWIREEYVNTDRRKNKIQEGGYRNDDVPFSCCDSASPRPCINHHVHDNDMHYSYDYRMKTTIYPQGCRESLVTFYGKQLMTYTGLALLATAVFQLIVVIMTRFLQTSIAQALELGDPEAPTMGYFFKPTAEDDEVDDGEAEPLLGGDDNDDEEDEPMLGGDDDEEEEDGCEDEEDDGGGGGFGINEDMYADMDDGGGGGGGGGPPPAPPPPPLPNRNRSNSTFYLDLTNNHQLGSAVAYLKRKKKKHRVSGQDVVAVFDASPKEKLRDKRKFLRARLRYGKRRQSVTKINDWIKAVNVASQDAPLCDEQIYTDYFSVHEGAKPEK